MYLSISRHRSRSQEGKLRNREDDPSQPVEFLERSKTLDLQLLLKSEELEIGKEKKTEPSNRVEDEATALGLSEIPVGMAMDHSSLEDVSTVLSLEQTDSFNKSEKPYLLTKNADLDSNFHPHKNSEQVRSMEASGESMRKWKEMKNNGFVSSFLGMRPIAKPWISQFKRKKVEKVKSHIEIEKKEHFDKHTNTSAPTGLLSGLNPGIIKHVRNSKQVNSIIEAILQSIRKPEKQELHGAVDQLRKGSKEDINGWENRSYPSEHESCNATADDVTLKLLSDATRASEHVTYTTHDGFLIKSEEIASLSIKAATVAWQWLEMIRLDIKGRLAALRRSKKRIKHVIQMELACLVSKELSAYQRNNEPPAANSSMSACFSKRILDIHVVQWKALFSQMEVSLFEEEKVLEKWLRQVKELQSKCAEGIEYVKVNGLTHLSSNMSDSKNREPWERGCAIRAAAASIYSTCNLIMTEKMSRF